MKKLKKCKAKDCKRMVEYPYSFCSYECACYSNAFNVVKGWIGKYARPKGK